MTSEKHAIEQLDQYITARQQGQDGGGNMLVDDLFALSESISTNDDVYLQVARGMNRQQNRRLQPFVRRFSTIAAVMVLMLAVFMAIPPLRAQIESFFNHFTVQETNVDPGMQPTALPPDDPSLIAPATNHNSQIGLSLEQVYAAVANSEIAFEMRTPGYMPQGFIYTDGIVDLFARAVTLHYMCTDRLTGISLDMGDLTNPVDIRWAQPVGSDADIIMVQVGETDAEYVQGDFGMDGMWDSNAPLQTLSWTKGNVFYRLRSYEQPSSCAVTRQDLITIAESLR